MIGAGTVVHCQGYQPVMNGCKVVCAGPPGLVSPTGSDSTMQAVFGSIRFASISWLHSQSLSAGSTGNDSL